MKNFICDGYEATFGQSEHSEFVDELKKIENDTEWVSTKVPNTTFMPLSSITSDDLACSPIFRSDEDKGLAYKDSTEGELPIAVQLEDTRKYPVREYLLKNIKHNHGDDAIVLSSMMTAGAYTEFCEHLNFGRAFRKKTVSALIRGGKVSGWFIDFNHNWSMREQVEFFESTMKERFERMAFQNASCSHYAICANYQLTGDCEEITDSPMDAYLESWGKAGFDTELLKQATPVCRFTSGESGLFSISVSPKLVFPAESKMPDMTIGPALSVNHRGKDESVWDKFKDFPEQTISLFNDGMGAVARLCELRVKYPYKCLTQILAQNFKAGVPASIMDDTAEVFKMEFDGVEDVRAIHVWSALNEMIAQTEKHASMQRTLNNIETLARLLFDNWGKYDKPKIGSYRSGVVDEEE